MFLNKLTNIINGQLLWYGRNKQLGGVLLLENNRLEHRVKVPYGVLFFTYFIHRITDDL